MPPNTGDDLFTEGGTERVCRSDPLPALSQFLLRQPRLFAQGTQHRAETPR
jgi:hypothetical protein